MRAVKYRAKNLFIANVMATSYGAEFVRSVLSASWRKLFNEMLWRAHNARPDETSGDGDVGRELCSQWATVRVSGDRWIVEFNYRSKPNV